MLSRLGWFFLWSPPLVVFIIAALLDPSPEGHGTHTQLGLPPCGFFMATGVPCPGCGLTTSFAHMIRFQWFSAVSANPFGVALFLASASCMFLAMWGFVRGVPVMRTLEIFHFEKVIVLLAGSSLAVWVVRVAAMG